MKCLLRQEQRVEDEIFLSLAEKFFLVFGGETCDDTHYPCLFACLSWKNSESCEAVLLVFSPIVEENSQNAGTHSEFIVFRITEMFRRSMDYIAKIIGDNCILSKALSQMFSARFVGCHFYRLSSAIYDVMQPYNAVILKMQRSMEKLSTPKSAASLQRYTTLRAVQFNATRWSFTVEMIQIYLKIEEFIAKLKVQGLQQFDLRDREKGSLNLFLIQLDDTDSVTK